MNRIWLIFPIAALAACQSTPKDPMIWLRTDGKRTAGDPVYQQQFLLDSTVCKGEQAKAAAGAPIVYQGPGLIGAVDAGIRQGQQNQALQAVEAGCMAAKGYVLVKSSEAEAVAARFRETAAATPVAQ